MYIEKCLYGIKESNSYFVGKKNPRIAAKINDSSNDFCIIIGNTPLPHNKVTAWNIKILKSSNNNGSCIFIGVAPSDINQNEGDNSDKCGWYFYCYFSTFWSGPSHNYNGKELWTEERKRTICSHRRQWEL